MGIFGGFGVNTKAKPVVEQPVVEHKDVITHEGYYGMRYKNGALDADYYTTRSLWLNQQTEWKKLSDRLKQLSVEREALMMSTEEDADVWLAKLERVEKTAKMVTMLETTRRQELVYKYDEEHDKR